MENGTFAGPDHITADELDDQPGTFGYLFPHELRFFRGKMFVSPASHIWRKASGEAIRVEKTEGGFNAEFVGFERYHWMMQQPDGEVIAVAQLKVGCNTYTQWSDELLYVSLDRMSVGSSGFIYRHQIKENNNRASTHRGASVEDKGGAGLVPVRRLSDCHYEVKLTARKWTDLIID